MRMERERANLCAPDFCCKNVICGINKIRTRSYGGPRAGQALRRPVSGGWEGAGPGDWRVKCVCGGAGPPPRRTTSPAGSLGPGCWQEADTVHTGSGQGKGAKHHQALLRVRVPGAEGLKPAARLAQNGSRTDKSPGS